MLVKRSITPLAVIFALLNGSHGSASWNNNNNDDGLNIRRPVQPAQPIVQLPRTRLYSVPHDFDAETYLMLHDDLTVGAAGKSSYQRAEFARNHYMKHGYPENRIYSKQQAGLPADFSSWDYLYYNPDLQAFAANMGSVERDLYAIKHFLRQGRQEERVYSLRPAGLPENFYHFNYLSLYPDLEAATRNMSEDEKRKFAVSHYMYHGRGENRYYETRPAGVPNDFNAQVYVNQNPDLAQAWAGYDADMRAAHARNHYVKFGSREGRKYKDPAVEAARLARERAVIEEQARVEREKVAREERERLERERLAREEQRRLDEYLSIGRMTVDEAQLWLVEHRNEEWEDRLSRGDDEALPEDQWMAHLLPSTAAELKIGRGDEVLLVQPFQCCVRFLLNVDNQGNGFRTIQPLIQDKIDKANTSIERLQQENRPGSRARMQERRFFWEQMLANVQDAQQGNTDKFGIEFLNELFETLSLPNLQANFGQNLWTKKKGVELLQSINLLLYAFSKLSEEQQAYVLLEWKYHIIPSIQKTCQWIQEIEAQGYNRLMDECLANCPAGNALIKRKINAFRLPVVNVREYMFKYLEMLLNYMQNFGQINDQCVLYNNLNEVAATTRFNSIYIDLTANENSYLHPEYCTYLSFDVFSSVHFIGVVRNFAINFLDSYKAFRDAGLLRHFYENVLARQRNALCLNARSANLVDARVTDLPLLRQPVNGYVVLRDGSVNSQGPSVLVQEVLEELMNDRVVVGLEGISIEAENLHEILTDFFQIGHANVVRGSTGEVTVQHLKDEIRRLVKKYTQDMAGIKDPVLAWAKTN